MRTILYQGKPSEEGRWVPLPADFVPSYKRLDYEARELVPREEADLARVASFNAGVEKAAALVEVKCSELARKIRELKSLELASAA